MLLMLEKGIRGEICLSIYWYTKVITNIWKIMIKTKNCKIFNIGM